MLGISKGIFGISFDFSKNTYKNDITELSGINLRIFSFGIGYHFSQGEEPSSPRKSPANPSSIYTRYNLQGYFIDVQYFYDLIPLYCSVYILAGYGETDGSQLVYTKYLSDYPQEVKYKEKYIYGYGLKIYPWEWLTIGIKWDSENKLSLSIGYSTSFGERPIRAIFGSH